MPSRFACATVRLVVVQPHIIYNVPTPREDHNSQLETISKPFAGCERLHRPVAAYRCIAVSLRIRLLRAPCDVTVRSLSRSTLSSEIVSKGQGATLRWRPVVTLRWTDDAYQAILISYMPGLGYPIPGRTNFWRVDARLDEGSLPYPVSTGADQIVAERLYFLPLQ